MQLTYDLEKKDLKAYLKNWHKKYRAMHKTRYIVVYLAIAVLVAAIIFLSWIAGNKSVMDSVAILAIVVIAFVLIYRVIPEVQARHMLKIFRNPLTTELTQSHIKHGDGKTDDHQMVCRRERGANQRTNIHSCWTYCCHDCPQKSVRRRSSDERVFGVGREV